MADTKRTRADLLTALFQDGQAEGSITPQDIRDLIVSMETINGGFWEFWLDSQYTVSSKLAISAGVRTQVTCDGLLNNQFKPSFHNHNFWNTSTNKIEPVLEGDFLDIRFAISGNSVSASANDFFVEVDVGGSAGVIYADNEVFHKGTADQSFNIIMPLFVGSDFATNGGTVYITPTNDINIWQSAFTISRTYKVPV